MNETVFITLIITLGVLIVLWMFRNQLSRFFFKANRTGIEAELHTHEPAKKTPPKRQLARPSPKLPPPSNSAPRTAARSADRPTRSAASPAPRSAKPPATRGGSRTAATRSTDAKD